MAKITTLSHDEIDQVSGGLPAIPLATSQQSTPASYYVVNIGSGDPPPRAPV